MTTPTSCQCSGPGYCAVMKRQMSEVRWRECREKPGYFQMFLKEAMPTRETLTASVGRRFEHPLPVGFDELDVFHDGMVIEGGRLIWTPRPDHQGENQVITKGRGRSLELRIHVR